MGYKYIIPRPCNPTYIVKAIDIWRQFGLFRLSVNKNFLNFNIINIKGPGIPINFSINVVDMAPSFPQIQPNGDITYQWNGVIPELTFATAGKYTLSFS